MKTKTQSSSEAAAAGDQPGNLTTRQLAASLAKTPGAGEEATAAAEAASKENEAEEGTGAEAETEAAERETPSRQAGGSKPKPDETEGSEGQGEAEGTEAGTEAGAEGAGAEAEAEGEAAGSEGQAEEPEAGAEAPKAGAELPAELADAMELAKAEGKTGTAKLLKRVHKLVDERDAQRNARLATEEQNAQLRTELQELRKNGENGNGNGASRGGEFTPPEVARAQAELRNVDHWLGWCEEHPDGGTIPDGKGGEIELAPERVRQIRRELEGTRTELVTRKVAAEHDYKRAYAAEYQKQHALAVEQNPWLKDEKSAEAQEMQQILRVFPTLKQSPDWEVVLGHYFRGRAAYEAAQKAKAAAKANGAARKAAPAREPTRVRTEPTGGARSSEAAEKGRASDADQQFRTSGRMSDLAKSFAARARATRTTR